MCIRDSWRIAGRSSGRSACSSRVRESTTLLSSPSARSSSTASATPAPYASGAGTGRTSQSIRSAAGAGSAISGSSRSAPQVRSVAGTASSARLSWSNATAPTTSGRSTPSRRARARVSATRSTSGRPSWGTRACTPSASSVRVGEAKNASSAAARYRPSSPLAAPMTVWSVPAGAWCTVVTWNLPVCEWSPDAARRGGRRWSGPGPAPVGARSRWGAGPRCCSPRGPGPAVGVGGRDGPGRGRRGVVLEGGPGPARGPRRGVRPAGWRRRRRTGRAW